MNLKMLKYFPNIGLVVALIAGYAYMKWSIANIVDQPIDIVLITIPFMIVGIAIIKFFEFCGNIYLNTITEISTYEYYLVSNAVKKYPELQKHLKSNGEFVSKSDFLGLKQAYAELDAITQKNVLDALIDVNNEPKQ